MNQVVEETITTVTKTQATHLQSAAPPLRGHDADWDSIMKQLREVRVLHFFRPIAVQYLNLIMVYQLYANELLI